ncbi:hypothetical protein VB618_16850 [Microvirga sp. CF3062]|uniref:hypothetical protein n=1 Tax=Microvirga sp. CF3062 TaxID=3110182 RepID=UPI002E772C91|nr:hypothetical protein [Microvirga sp. CF3062]MEE1657871.1 hypothetical protein [Microvirga sp. CF3062]
MHFLPSGLSRITSGFTDKTEKEVMLGNHRLIDGLSHEAIKNLNIGVTHHCLFLLLAGSAAVGSTGRHASPCQFGDLRSGYHHGWLSYGDCRRRTAQAMVISIAAIVPSSA